MTIEYARTGNTALCIDWSARELAAIAKAKATPSYGKKLSADDAQAIRCLFKNGAKRSIIARRYGVSHATVCDIIDGRTHCRNAG